MSLQSIYKPLNPEKYQVTATSGAIAASLAKSQLLQLVQIRVHLNEAGGAGNLSITLNDGTNAKYYTALISPVDMTALTDYIYSPTIPIMVLPGDSVDVAWANAGNKTYGVTFIYQAL